MKKFIVLLLLAGVVYACNQMQEDDVSAPAPQLSQPIKFCTSGPNQLCSILPIDLDTNLVKGFGYDSFLDSAKQPPFDQFSWQTFVALNWPSDASGKPIGNSIGDHPGALRVWEHYQDPAEIFGASGADMVLHMSAAKKENAKFFYLDSKAPHPLLPFRDFEEADGHPLIDRNLNFAVFEIKINPIEATFITTNKLTTKKGIDSFYFANGKSFKLPQGDSATGNPGSMEIKASWRILDPAKGDDTSRYYCRNAVIYVDSASNVTGKPMVVRAKVGLVGMHILRKSTFFSEMMIWSTFEHVDNTPDNPQEAQMANKQWSFYNPACLNCIPNDTPAFRTGDASTYRWDSTYPYGKRYAVKAPSQPGDSFGTQAVRVYPVFKYTEQMSNAWRAKLKGTVWSNYRLVGSQWQSAESIPASNAPAYLANTTLETYIQPTASCITCHHDAGIKFGKTKIPTDMSFVFPVYAK